MRSRNAGSATNVRMAAREIIDIVRLVMSPVSLSSTNSFGPPESETITGRPVACASMMTLPKVSVVLGKTKISAEA